MLKYELISNIGSQLTLKIFSNNTQYLVKLQKYENQKGIYVTDLYNYKWECFLNGDQKLSNGNS